MKRSLFVVLALVGSAGAAEPAVSLSTAAVAGADRASAIDAQWQSGQRKQANADVRRWMKDEEKSPWPWVAAASLRYNEKKYRACVSMADGAIKRDPTAADAYYWRGRCLESRGKTLEAANEYGAALEAQPQHPLASEGRNRLRAQLGETSAEVRPN